MEQHIYFVENLKKLSDIFSQNQIAKETGVSPASINNYLKGTTEPSIAFLCSIKQAYGFNIDDFMFSNINISKNEVVSTSDISRYLGNFLVYYYDSTAYQGRVSNYARNTLNYGVISLFRNRQTKTKVSAKACFMSDRKEAEQMLKDVNSLPVDEVESYFENKTNVYRGKLEENPSQIFITLRNFNNSDQSFIILNNPPSAKEYVGGLGTVNSVSRGREQVPCIQYILLTRAPLIVPDGEIYNMLSVDVSNIEVGVETEQLIELFKSLYINQNDLTSRLTEYQKKKIIEDAFQNTIEELIDANIFRFAKVSNMDDDKLYRIIKDGMIDG